MIAAKKRKNGKIMNKKVIILIVVIIVIAALVIGGYFLFNKSDKNNNKETSIANDNNGENPSISSNGKILVVYYSASGSTKKVAEQSSKNLNADMFEIIPEDKYTSDDLDWTDDNSRVSREHNDKSLRNIKLTKDKVDNWKDYDTVLIGYPIWWGVAAWPVNTFVKKNNFDGKIVIPFCTSASSELGTSGELLEKEAKGGNWLEGHRFSSGASSSDIKEWTDSLK